MQLSNGFTIESVDPKSIAGSDLVKIHEIEQDTWASHIGEYMKCKCCGKIHSKEDIFGHLSKDIFQQTVSRIEKILGIDNIACQNCGGATYHIFSEAYMNDIQERYNRSKSFLSVYRDDQGEIRGFLDGYIDDFETIYSREFEQYYEHIGMKQISQMVKKILYGDMPDLFLTSNTLAIEKGYANLKVFFLLIQFFYKHMYHLGYRNIVGVYESLMNHVTTKIYQGCGARSLGFSQKGEFLNTSFGKESDIFVHNNVVESYALGLPSSPKDFFAKLH